MFIDKLYRYCKKYKRISKKQENFLYTSSFRQLLENQKNQTEEFVRDSLEKPTTKNPSLVNPHRQIGGNNPNY